eukprot:s3800_g4.t1
MFFLQEEESTEVDQLPEEANEVNEVAELPCISVYFDEGYLYAEYMATLLYRYITKSSQPVVAGKHKIQAPEKTHRNEMWGCWQNHGFVSENIN